VVKNRPRQPVQPQPHRHPWAHPIEARQPNPSPPRCSQTVALSEERLLGQQGGNNTEPATQFEANKKSSTPFQISCQLVVVVVKNRPRPRSFPPRFSPLRLRFSFLGTIQEGGAAQLFFFVRSIASSP
jgi:hypothetical protein